MIFSSWQFILLFLPITFTVYFLLNQKQFFVAGKVWLVLASGFFYAYWDTAYLPLIVISILFNYGIGTWLAKGDGHHKAVENSSSPVFIRKLVLAGGVALNLVLLGYYKYTSFVISNINALFGTNYQHHSIALPLAISFFTFTQIAYLVDSYREETSEYNLLNYTLFVTFFPHLIAGPIVHHRDLMPQFASREATVPWSENIWKGLFIFSIGLFKKVVIADTFSIWANAGFDGVSALGFYPAWAASLSYTFQLYFDFSGYCDMAIGAALLFNIWLPVNFNSPYKASDIQDFWRRWHITLSTFLRDYLYIPLGGNRCGKLRIYLNIFITFLLGGLWHGATWMYVIWGAMHGIALVINRLWKTLNRPLHPVAGWLVTFVFVNFAWVLFRAKSLDDARRVLRGMLDIRSAFGVNAASVPVSDVAWGGWLSDHLLRFVPGMVGMVPSYLAIMLAFVLIARKNSMELLRSSSGSGAPVYAGVLFSVAMCFTLATASTVFLYFNF